MSTYKSACLPLFSCSHVSLLFCSLILKILFVYFLNNIIMTTESTLKCQVCINNNFTSERMPQQSVTSWKWGGLLRFVFSYALPVTQHYKRRTVQETWIHSIQKIRAKSMHCLGEAILCYSELTFSVVSKKNWNTKGKSMMCALYILQLVKRHILGWSDVEQWRNQARSHIHYQVTLGWRREWASEWVSEWASEWASEWVSEWVGWWVSEWEWVSINSVKKKILKNFIKTCWKGLGSFWRHFELNQCSQAAKLMLVFGWYFGLEKPCSSWLLIYSTTALYNNHISENVNF